MIFIVFELVFFGILLASDLVSKHFVMPFLAERLEDDLSYVVIKDVLTFQYKENGGAGLSLLDGKTGFLIGVTVVAMFFLTLFIVACHFKKVHKKTSGRVLLCSLIMILSGGIANLYDRIAFKGYVRDFIQYTFLEKIFGSYFFTCNVADIWVTLGVVLLIVYILFMYKPKKPEKAVEPDDDYEESSVSIALRMLDDQQENNDNE